MKREDIKAGVVYAENHGDVAPRPVVFLEDRAATVWKEPWPNSVSREYTAADERPEHRVRGFSGRSSGYATVRGDEAALTGLDCSAELAAFQAGGEPSREGLRFELCYSLVSISGLYAEQAPAFDRRLAAEEDARRCAQAETATHQARLLVAVARLARLGIKSGPARANSGPDVLGLDVDNAERLLALLDGRGPGDAATTAATTRAEG